MKIGEAIYSAQQGAGAGGAEGGTEPKRRGRPGRTSSTPTSRK